MSFLKTNVTNEHNAKPPRIVVYGKAGIGKTTFAASSTKPLLIDLEGSADYLAVDKVKATNLQKVKETLLALQDEKHDYKTVVIDSLDWLERIIHEDICKQTGAKTITDKTNQTTAYGNGYIVAVNKFLDIRNMLDALRDSKNMSVILTAHSLVKTRNDPLDGDFDEHVLKMHEKTASAAVEWADAVLLIKKKSIESANAKSGRIEGETILVTSNTLGTTTKNRLHLPKEIPATWQNLLAAVGTNVFNPTN